MRTMPLRALVLLLYGYVVWRIAPALGSVVAGGAFAAVLAVAALTLPFAFGRARPPHRFARAFAWAGLLGMGLFSSLFVLTLGRDLALAVARLVAATGAFPLATGALGVRSAQVVAAAALLATAWGFVNARRTAGVVRVDVPLAGLPDPLAGFAHRPDQRRPRRADDPAAVPRGDRRRREPARTPTRRRSPATSSTVGRRARRARRAARRACARATARSSSPATTSTTRAQQPGCASCAGSASSC